MPKNFSKSTLKFITNRIAHKTMDMLVSGDGSDPDYVARRDETAEKFAKSYQEKTKCDDAIKNQVRLIYATGYTQKYLDDVMARNAKMKALSEKQKKE